MGGNVIEETPTYKYLGIIIDQKLNWQPQIAEMCSKLSSVCGILSKVRHYLDRNALMLIYNRVYRIWGKFSKFKFSKRFRKLGIIHGRK